MNQRRCKACRVRFVWAPNGDVWGPDSGVKVGDAVCPLCRRTLARTTTHCRDRVALTTPAAVTGPRFLPVCKPKVDDAPGAEGS